MKKSLSGNLKHTPTLYRVDGIDDRGYTRVLYGKGTDSRELCSSFYEDNAKLIVKACNSHEALLEACKEAEKDTRLHGRIKINTHGKLIEAIKLAEQA